MIQEFIRHGGENRIYIPLEREPVEQPNKPDPGGYQAVPAIAPDAWEATCLRCEKLTLGFGNRDGDQYVCPPCQLKERVTW